jgi:hypothetical protein
MRNVQMHYGLVLGLLFVSLAGLSLGGVPARAALPAPQAPVARQLGTIKSIDGNHLVLTTDAGDVSVTVPDGTSVVRIEPGEKDLKNAVPMDLKGLQAGDRILVRGSGDSKSFTASNVIAMKHADVEAKQQQERDDWQRHGIGGLVSGVDPAASLVTISVGAPGALKSVPVHIGKDTTIRRYALDSVKFDDAKPSSLDAIKAGDQLRARGAAGATFEAQEIVTGSFRNIAGTIQSVDVSNNTMSVNDLIAKHPVTVKLTVESQVRKLAPEAAQRIAMRLKAASAGPAAGANPPSSDEPQRPPAAGNPGAGGGRGGAPDLQQMLGRTPPAKLSDLQKGEAVMIVSSGSASSDTVTAITVLGGVEAILTAAPQGAQAMTLSPWSLGGGEGDAGAN